LVEGLGSSAFSNRESAMRQLSEANESVLSELEMAFQGLGDDDLEAKIRMNSIIVRIKNDRSQNQIRVFLRSTDPDNTQGFEGWKSFSRVAGLNRNSKMLFLGLLETYPGLVFSELKSKKEALDKAKDIAKTIDQKMRTIAGFESTDAIAMFYCFNVADDLTERSLEGIAVRILRTYPFPQFMQEPQSRKSVERLISGWSQRIEDRLYECLLVLVQTNYPQAKELAVRMLSSDKMSEEPDELVKAMQAMFRFGSATDLPIVDKWLDDKTVCFIAQNQGFGNPQVPVDLLTVEFRDVALLVSMHLAGEDYSDEFRGLRTIDLWGFRPESLLLPPNADAFRAKRINAWKAKRQESVR